MTGLLDFFNLAPQYIGIFLLMLSAFLIGYFSAHFSQKNKHKKILKKIKRKYNTLMVEKYNNLPARNGKGTNGSNIKSEIVQSFNHKKVEADKKESVSKNDIAEKTSASYLNYTQNKPTLYFDTIGNASALDSDDLTLINGIGPYIEGRLNEIGIFTFQQISNLQPKDIRTITLLIDFFPDRIEKDRWVEQAKSLLLKEL